MITKAKLAAYILTMMKFWYPVDQQAKLNETAAEAEVRYASIADDVVDVVLDQNEPAIFTDREGGKAKTAVLLGSLAFNETHFWKFADMGLCNDPTWRSSAEGRQIIRTYGHCDGGVSWTMWQMQTGHGLIFDGDVWQRATNKGFEWITSHQDEVITGPKMIKDRKLASRMALHMARRAMKAGNLCAYTGEVTPDGTCTAKHPKATVRLQTANVYYAGHPFNDE